MCTYLIRFDPDHEWPFLIAGNRDELRGRPALPPGRHWDDRADVPEMDFGTVSSALIALPCAELALGRQDGTPTGFADGSVEGSIDDGAVAGQAAPVFLYADGPGDRAPYQPVAD